MTGLSSGASLALQLGNGAALTVAANGAFSFPGGLATGTAYLVSVATQPTGETCSLTNASGTVASSNITNVGVSCASPSIGALAFVANSADNTVSVYSINASTGALTAVRGSPFATGTTPSSVAINPAGTLAFVANENSSNVSVYSINATTGALTQVSGSPFATGGIPGGIPFSVAINPAGTLAFVANSADNTVSVYSINATTGALTAVPGSPFAAGTNPYSVAINPAGTLAFVANVNSNTVSVYSINASTGALTQVSGSPFATGTGPASVAVTTPLGSQPR